MGSQDLIEIPLALKQDVSIVFYKDSQPHVIAATVISDYPLQVEAHVPFLRELAKQRRAMLVHWNGDLLVRSEVQVTEVRATGTGWKLSLHAIRWDHIDRRQTPRYTVKLNSIVRAIAEVEGYPKPIEIPCCTSDVSLGGCCLELDHRLEPKSLVEVQISLSPFEIVRCLGMVAEQKPGLTGSGIEFLDYIGSAHYYLSNFLSKLN